MLKAVFQKIKKWFLGISDDHVLLYLCGGEALPKTLSKEEEAYWVMKLDHNDQEAKKILIEHNLRLVVYIAKKFDGVDTDLEDLISIGSIGLIKAINSYKSDKNIKIATYASKCIENEILMHIRKISKMKHEISIDEPLSVDGEGNELVLGDVLQNEMETPQEEFEQSAEKQILWHVINSMNEREQEIMCLRFGLRGYEEQTQKEVADSLGISQSYISRLEKKIVGRIKKEMSKFA